MRSVHAYLGMIVRASHRRHMEICDIVVVVSTIVIDVATIPMGCGGDLINTQVEEGGGLHSQFFKYCFAE